MATTSTSSKIYAGYAILDEPRQRAVKRLRSSIPDEPINKATEKEKHLRRLFKITAGYADAMHQVPRIDCSKMSPEEFQDYLRTRQAKITQIWHDKNDKDIKAAIAKDAPLLKKRNRVTQKNKAIRAEEMQKYLKDNPLDKKSFKSDVTRYSTICVFSFGCAKLESPQYKNFIKSLKDDSSYKVYFGRNQSLSKIVGVVREEEWNPELKPGDQGYGTLELLPGLHEIGIMLESYDDAAVILTDKTKDEVLRKIREYIEYDYLKPGQTPMEPLVFEKGDFLFFHPRVNIENLCSKLQNLGMPVIIGVGRLELTENFTMCEDGVRVTENATKILRLLKRKMFKYVLVPLCCRSASTGKTEYFALNLPNSR